MTRTSSGPIPRPLPEGFPLPAVSMVQVYAHDLVAARFTVLSRPGPFRLEAVDPEGQGSWLVGHASHQRFYTVVHGACLGEAPSWEEAVRWATNLDPRFPRWRFAIIPFATWDLASDQRTALMTPIEVDDALHGVIRAVDPARISHH